MKRCWVCCMHQRNWTTQLRPLTLWLNTMPLYLVFLPDTVLSQHNGLISGALPVVYGLKVLYPVSQQLMFVSTGGAGGGQESTIKNAMSYLVHHGMPYIPLGYSNTFAEMANLDEVHGASAWGSGIFAGSDGSRQPSELELKICHAQGAAFANIASKIVGAKAATATTTTEPAATANEPASKSGEEPTEKGKSGEEPTEKAKEVAQRAKQAAPEVKEEAKGGCMKCTIM